MKAKGEGLAKEYIYITLRQNQKCGGDGKRKWMGVNGSWNKGTSVIMSTIKVKKKN